MGRRSSIKQLDPRIREAVDAALAGGQATIEEIVAMIRQMGGEASRSAVGRYKVNFEEDLQEYRAVQEASSSWYAQFKADPGGDVSRVLTEMVKVLAIQSVRSVREEGAGQGADPLDLARLTRAVRDVVSIERIKAEAEARGAAKVKAGLGQVLDKVAAEASGTGGRLPQEVLDRIRRDVYGITTPAAGEAA